MPEGEEPAPSEPSARQHAPAEQAPAAHAPPESVRQLPPPSLQLHVFHLASQVTMALGEIENPLTGKRELDLPTARFLIDLIALLQAKTEGNRDAEEDAYLAGVLTNLRLAYVSKAR